MVENFRDIKLDEVIQKLLDPNIKLSSKNTILSEKEMRFLCEKSKDIFKEQPMLLEVTSPLVVCGDIHGQYYDLIRLLEVGGPPPSSRYLFLGDYVDRGKQSLETICLLLAYKIKYPNNFYLLRGNHEAAVINKTYGFYDECKKKCDGKIWKSFCEVFNWMPVSAVIDNKILCMHGGLSKELENYEQIKKIARPTDVPDQGKIIIKNEGLLCDILWSDPSDEINTEWEKNERGVSYVFSKNVVNRFLTNNKIDLIIRAHQVVEDGYEFFSDQKLVTIFSAPNYCGEFDNCGAIMIIDESLTCSFKILKPIDSFKTQFNKGKNKKKMKFIN